jgi:guanylate kinase
MSAAGMLLIISGPSGSGKSTLVRRLTESNEFPLVFSVSATSRAKRPGETDGVEYEFVSAERFEQMRSKGELLEWATVHGNSYGTPRRPVEKAVEAGKWPLLEIDMEGHRQVKRIRSDAVSFFIRTPTIEQYESRLRGRKTDDEESIRRRVRDARDQLAFAGEYDFQIVNEDLDQSYRTLRTLLIGAAADRAGSATSRRISE